MGTEKCTYHTGTVQGVITKQTHHVIPIGHEIGYDISVLSQSLFPPSSQKEITLLTFNTIHLPVFKLYINEIVQYEYFCVQLPLHK